MNATGGPADTAFRVADRLRSLAPPWDVFAERVRRYEIHLSAGRIELLRGPVGVEGYGIRVLRPQAGALSVGLQSSTDLTQAGIEQVVTDAETNARYSKFPAASIELPSKKPSASGVEISDPSLWKDPPGELQGYVAELLESVGSERDASVTFGSVKVALVETTLANSSNLAASYSHATVQTEIGVQARGGPEGPAAGEYWVTGLERRLDRRSIAEKAREWVRIARDVRLARAPPTGELPVLLPAEVLDGILPAALDFQFTGAGRLHELSPPAGTRVGPEFLHLEDSGGVPWAVGSAPFDDEGIGQRSRELIRSGSTGELLCDLSYASAIGAESTGSGWRLASFGPPAWFRFSHPPQPSSATLVIPGGTGGSDTELIETVGDGIWVQQLGWASPNSATTGFGGEVRIGYRIRNGRLAEPIRGGTVGGTVISGADRPSLFGRLIAIGKEPELVGGCSVPTLLTRGLTVSGDAS